MKKEIAARTFSCVKCGALRTYLWAINDLWKCEVCGNHHWVPAFERPDPSLYRSTETETDIEISDNVNHPPHYKAHPSGVECIQITEHYNFNLGNVIKYIWRSAHKKSLIEDLKKARWYLDREITRLTDETLSKKS